MKMIQEVLLVNSNALETCTKTHNWKKKKEKKRHNWSWTSWGPHRLDKSPARGDRSSNMPALSRCLTQLTHICYWAALLINSSTDNKEANPESSPPPLKDWKVLKKKTQLGFLGGPPVRNPPANAGDPGSIPGLGRSHNLWSN